MHITREICATDMGEMCEKGLKCVEKAAKGPKRCRKKG